MAHATLLRTFASVVVAWALAGSPTRFGAEDLQPQPSPPGVLPVGADGKPLNLDFESGTLADWTVAGAAFEGQPIADDTVARRRADMRSAHQGRFWIGGYELLADAPQGTLTSAPFKVTMPFASFLVGGGAQAGTRVELVRRAGGKVLVRAVGRESESLRRVSVDLRAAQGDEVFIRLVDEHSGAWGHVNFDDFRFHAVDPQIAPAEGEAPLVLDEYPYAGLTADEAARVMSVPEGFAVTVYAAEPDVVQPVAMAFDDRGRLWIAEAVSYPRRRAQSEALDRILILEDSDGDGRADKRTVFLEHLNLVSGLEVGFGGVWIGAAPYLYFVPDRDGDDRPDGEPQVLLDGWGFQDTHETLNAFIWGPDGWLYGCHGVFTHSDVGKPGALPENRQKLNAGVWRYHPQAHVFEVFCHGTSNPWGVDFDDYGEAVITACVIPHLYHAIQGGRYQRQAGRHFNPHTYDDIKTIADHRHYLGANPHGGNNRSDGAGGGHAHSGAMVYLGGAWPERYRGQVFMSDIHGQRVNVDALERHGSGLIGRHERDFLLTRDRASQIVNLRYGPDGHVYLIDWYDLQACHTTDVERVDRASGRVYRVSYKGAPRPRVDLTKLSDAELVERTLDANDWHVRHARKVLQARSASQSISPELRHRLRGIAFSHADPTRRLRALWVLHATGSLAPADIERGLDNDSEPVRAWCVRLLLDPPGAGAALTDAFHARLVDLAHGDTSQVVRLHLAAALQRLPLSRRWDILTELSLHPEDAQDHNLPLMYWYAAEPLAVLDRERALNLAAQSRIPLVASSIVRRLAFDGRKEVLEPIVALLRAEVDGVRRQAFVEGLYAALEGRRRLQMPPSWPAVFRALAGASDGKLASRVRALAVIFDDPAGLGELRQLVNRRDTEDSERRDALAALAAAGDPELPPILLRLLRDRAMRSAALRALAAYQDPQVPEALLGMFSDLSRDERADALGTLASRLEYARTLVDALGSGRLSSRDIPADVVRQLHNLGDAQLSARLTELWGHVRGSAAEKAAEIAAYRARLSTPAPEPVDASLGRAVFARTCQQCHALFGVGGAVGPDLTGSNRADIDYVLTNVLDPSAVMAKEYAPSVLILKDGRVLTGIVRQDDGRRITVLTANETVLVVREDVASSRVDDRSMMPDDLFKNLDEREVRALMVYLASREQVPLAAAAENAAGLFNGRDLSGWQGNPAVWRVEGGEIVARTEGLPGGEVLRSDMAVADFRLSLKVKMAPDTEQGGVHFRGAVLPDGGVKGYRAGIGKGAWGKLREEHGRELIWDRSGDMHARPGEWNEYVVVAVGSRVRTSINGVLCVDLDDPPGARRGILALAAGAGGRREVRFKDLKLEVLGLGERRSPQATGR